MTSDLALVLEVSCWRGCGEASSVRDSIQSLDLINEDKASQKFRCNLCIEGGEVADVGSADGDNNLKLI